MHKINKNSIINKINSAHKSILLIEEGAYKADFLTTQDRLDNVLQAIELVDEVLLELIDDVSKYEEDLEPKKQMPLNNEKINEVVSRLVEAESVNNLLHDIYNRGGNESRYAAAHKIISDSLVSANKLLRSFL